MIVAPVFDKLEFDKLVHYFQPQLLVSAFDQILEQRDESEHEFRANMWFLKARVHHFLQDEAVATADLVEALKLGLRSSGDFELYLQFGNGLKYLPREVVVNACNETQLYAHAMGKDTYVSRIDVLRVRADLQLLDLELLPRNDESRRIQGLGESRPIHPEVQGSPEALQQQEAALKRAQAAAEEALQQQQAMLKRAQAAEHERDKLIALKQTWDALLQEESLVNSRLQEEEEKLRNGNRAQDIQVLEQGEFELNRRLEVLQDEQDKLRKAFLKTRENKVRKWQRQFADQFNFAKYFSPDVVKNTPVMALCNSISISERNAAGRATKFMKESQQFMKEFPAHDVQAALDGCKLRFLEELRQQGRRLAQLSVEIHGLEQGRTEMQNQKRALQREVDAILETVVTLQHSEREIQNRKREMAKLFQDKRQLRNRELELVKEMDAIQETITMLQQSER